MKIYHYLRDFPAEAAHFNGGLEKAVAGLAIGMVANGTTCTVLCEGKNSVDITRPEGFRVRCFDNTSTAHKRFGLAPALRNFVLTELEPDALVILHAIFNPSVC